MFFVVMVNARSEVNHRVHAGERVSPVRRGTDRLDDHFVGRAGPIANRAADNPSGARHCRGKVATDKAVRARHQDYGSAILHGACSGCGLCRSSRSNAA
jgi:hypothetical protein